MSILKKFISNVKEAKRLKQDAKWTRLSLVQAENNHEDISSLIIKLNAYVKASQIHRQYIENSFGILYFLF